MISPRVPMTSSRTTLFCFGDGPLFLGAQCPNPRMATRHLRVMTPRLRETATAQSTGPYQKTQHAECEDADREFLGVLCGLCVQTSCFSQALSATNTDKRWARIPSIIPRMKRFMTLVLGAAVMGAGATARTQQPNAPQLLVAEPAMAVGHKGTTSSESQTAVIKQYCVGCHNDRTKAGQLTLAAFDVADPAHSAEVAEKMIRKLRAGLMPPPGSRRPDEAALAGLADTLSAHADARATEFTPGRRTFQRLNRAEYARSIHDLLALDVNASDYLPLDAKSANFDNIADAQLLSPTLMQAYLTAAAEISRLAVGDPSATAREATYPVSRWTSQREHVEGAPYGTRGGVSVVHTFPADGDYRFRVSFYHETTGALYGNGRAALHTAAAPEQIEISIDGDRVALLDLDRWMSTSDPDGVNLRTDAIAVTAGPHRVSAAFIRRFEGPAQDLISPLEWSLASTSIADAYGFTTLPHLRDLAIIGPFTTTGVSDTPSRRRIFACRPRSAAQQIGRASCRERV